MIYQPLNKNTLTTVTERILCRVLVVFHSIIAIAKLNINVLRSKCHINMFCIEKNSHYLKFMTPFGSFYALYLKTGVKDEECKVFELHTYHILSFAYFEHKDGGADTKNNDKVII